MCPNTCGLKYSNATVLNPARLRPLSISTVQGHQPTQKYDTSWTPGQVAMKFVSLFIGYSQVVRQGTLTP